MGFRSVRETDDEATADRGRFAARRLDAAGDRRSETAASGRAGGHGFSAEDCEQLFGLEVYRSGMATRIQRLADTVGAGQVGEWADEGMPVEVMGAPGEMEAFRERQAERPPEVPTDVERRNARSVQRSKDAHHEAAKAGDTQVPDTVRDVISSAGRSLDDSIQRAVEERMGDDLGDVRIHTGPKAAQACQDINARAFTVGNHVAFDTGEYDPESPEGQHVLVHELAHVRQQTGGAVSMLPQPGELRIDPDQRLEREAEETAERVLRGGELGVKPFSRTEYHVQRLPKQSSSFYEQVIDAIKRESSLTDDDVDRIKDEVAQEVAGTDYDGARGHDELNVKILEQAREAAAKKAEEIESLDSLERDLEEARVEKVLAEADLAAGNDDGGSINSLTDGDETPMDAIHEYAQLEKERPELAEKVEELDRELESLLADENVRLTSAQEAEIEALEQTLADKLDSHVAELAVNYLANYFTEATASVSVSGLFADALGTTEAATVAAALVTAISMGLAMLAQTVTDDYVDEDIEQREGDKVEF